MISSLFRFSGETLSPGMSWQKEILGLCQPSLGDVNAGSLYSMAIFVISIAEQSPDDVYESRLS